MSDIPDFLQACLDKFWEDNKELRDRVLRDIYIAGRVSTETNGLGQKAIDIWLQGKPAISTEDQA